MYDLGKFEEAYRCFEKVVRLTAHLETHHTRSQLEHDRENSVVSTLTYIRCGAFRNLSNLTATKELQFSNDLKAF